MDETETDDVPLISAVQVSNPCHTAHFEIFNASPTNRVSSLHEMATSATTSLPILNSFSLGQNYAQTDHVNKFKRSSSSRQHKIIMRAVTGSNKHDEKRLRHAVSNGELDQVQKLLDSGVDPCCVDEKLRSPLHIAVASGNINMVQLLLDAGANPNQKDIISNTPLHLAACCNNIPVITALLRGGTDATLLDRSGRSPLHLALGRLHVLHNSKRFSSDQLKAEVVQIINMLQVYMSAVKRRQLEASEDNRTKVMSELDSLSKQLEQTTTINEIDSVSSLLSDLARLQIEQLSVCEVQTRCSEIPKTNVV